MDCLTTNEIDKARGDNQWVTYIGGVLLYKKINL
ncbi:hypothetical protein M948_16700 [Virgibacillus sp. CM-4]|nr:hypothetical protein M948_16700 [Virgibacillus sp. CM-4]